MSVHVTCRLERWENSQNYCKLFFKDQLYVKWSSIIELLSHYDAYTIHLASGEVKWRKDCQVNSNIVKTLRSYVHMYVCVWGGGGGVH